MALRNLLKIMCLPASMFVNFTVDSTGNVLAQEIGDIGFNAFMGKPNPQGPGIEWAWNRFRELSMPERRQVIKLACAKGVNLRDFLKRGEYAKNTVEVGTICDDCGAVITDDPVPVDPISGGPNCPACIERNAAEYHQER